PDGVKNAQEMRAWMNEQYEGVKNNYRRKHEWSDQSIRDRAVEVGAEDLYDLVHRRGSEMTHSNARALSTLYEIEKGGLTVRAEPSLPKEVFSVVIGSLVYIGLAVDVAERFAPSRVGELKALREELTSAGESLWKPPADAH